MLVSQEIKKSMNALAVIIASVPWRIENMIRLVDSVITQGFPVKLILDNYPEDEQIDIKSRFKSNTVSIFITNRERGYISRWRNIDSRQFIIIDDDLEPEKGFIENSLNYLECTDANLISWSGWPKVGKHIDLSKAIKADTELELFHASTTIGYGTDIAEFWNSEFATPEYIRHFMSVDDEGLLSAFYHSRGKKIIRPAGPSYIKEVSKYSRDNRRLYTKAQRILPGLRKELNLRCQ